MRWSRSPGTAALRSSAWPTCTSLPRAAAGHDTFEQGAALVLAYGTSLHALQQRARLQAGETLLVLGAAGGVGLAAIEIAKALGARVIAAASSADKLALCREAGADETIDYTTEDLRRRVDELTGGRGADVVYDPVGGAYSEAARDRVARRFLVVGFAAGEIPKLALSQHCSGATFWACSGAMRCAAIRSSMSRTCACWPNGSRPARYDPRSPSVCRWPMRPMRSRGWPTGR